MAGVRQFDEVEMLEKALAIFWQKGFYAATMQDLAAGTGVQRGSLYNAYGDKETLFLRVFEVYRETYARQMREALDKPDLRAGLRQLFSFIFKSLAAGNPPRSCLSTKTAVGDEQLDEPLRGAIRSLLDDIEALLVERFSRAGASSQLALDARQAARMIVCMTRGLVVIDRVYQDEKRLHEMAGLLIDTIAPARPKK